MTLYAILGSVVSVIVAIVGAFIWGGKSANRKKEARETEASLQAEFNRRKLDDEIAQDTDLATRARNAGLVRGDRDPE